MYLYKCLTLELGYYTQLLFQTNYLGISGICFGINSHLFQIANACQATVQALLFGMDLQNLSRNF